MNNPPDVTQDPAEHEEYAHGVHQHVMRYVLVGAILIAFTGLTVWLSYVDFGTHWANMAVAMVVATIKVSFVVLVFMHLAAEKRLIYRVLIFTIIFVLGLFWLTYLAWYNPIVR